jgi:fermentation-respiration switch protein FrsA (DUF1100 family)
VRNPKLVIHGKRDDIVPFSMGERLFEISKHPKYFFPLEGAGHNDTYVVGGTEYCRTLAAFAKDARL